MSSDAFNLQRFVDAQAETYDDALSELRAGSKRSHWMWYVLPQLQGLGASAMAARYAIRSLAEARSYLAHPVLGPRLHECVEAMNAHEGMLAAEILGDVDAIKFRSCLTLFSVVSPSDPVFKRALDKYFGGELDGATLARMAKLSGV